MGTVGGDGRSSEQEEDGCSVSRSDGEMRAGLKQTSWPKGVGRGEEDTPY